MLVDALEPKNFPPDPPALFALVMLLFPLCLFLGSGLINVAVTYLGRFRDQYTGLGAQTLAPKKHFSSFLFSVVFQQKIS